MAQVKIDDATRKQLKVQAAKEERTMSDIIIEAFGMYVKAKGGIDASYKVPKMKEEVRTKDSGEEVSAKVADL